ncbi:MAG: VOC family protein [Gordonibacter sp.]
MLLPDQRLSAFLTFNGNAEEAMDFYETVFPDAKRVSLVLFGADEPHGDEGKVLNGTLDLGGERVLFMDMQAAYPAPAFSWSTSLFITCPDEEDFDGLFAGLSAEGMVMMGPEPVGDLRKCAWVTDKFGVTWQLVWE